MRTLALEIFKTLNGLNPSFMQEIFNFSPYCSHRKNDIFVHHRNTVTYGNKSLKSLGPHVWNSLPEQIKALNQFQILKSL